MNQQAQIIYNDLRTRYKKSTISLKEYAHETGVSYSTAHNYLNKGYGVPNHKRLGTAKNAKVVFNLVDVAEFLSQTIKTA